MRQQPGQARHAIQAKVASAALLLAAFCAGVVQAAPRSPSNLAATVSGATVTLSWTAPPDSVAGYRLEAGTIPGASNAANTVIGVTPTFTTTGVPVGVYYVRVRAIGFDGESAPSEELIVVVGSTGCLAAPGPPANLSGTVSGTTLVFTWNPPASGCAATAYNVRAGSLPGLSDIAAVPVGGARSLTAVAPVGIYYVHVVAQNAYGTSGPSNVASLTVTGTTPAPAPPGPIPTPPGPTTTFGPGQHRINSDIAPGRYYGIPSDGCYWERQSGLGGSFDDIITNEFVGFDAGQWIVDILSTDVAFETDADCGTWRSAPVAGAQSTIRPGMWLVGTQLTPGVYQTTAAYGCYWARVRDFSGSLDAIISNEFVGSAGVQLVSLAADDAGFQTDDACGTWVRVSGDSAGGVVVPTDRRSIEHHWMLDRVRQGRAPKPFVQR